MNLDNRHKRYLHRILLTALTIALLCGLSLTVYAAEGVSESDQYIQQMGVKVGKWYQTIRYIAVPLLILSFASCGFRFVGVGFLQKGEFSADAVMKQFTTSVLTMIVLLLLPTILAWARSILEGLAWKPPERTSEAVVIILKQAVMIW